MGVIKEPPVLSGANIADIASHDLALVGEVGLEFLFEAADTLDVCWEATLYRGGRLLIDVPRTVLPDGSKESFVRLLEFAEEELECREVYVRFKKDRPDRAHLIRTFMYFGFAMLPPDARPIPSNSSHLLMVYKID